MRKYIEYVPLWELQISPRAVLTVSRMIDPEQEKKFTLDDSYLKKMETQEEYAKESKKRIKIKTDNEKFFINSIITGFDNQPFRSKGLSIYRYQLPELINALQDIHDGKHDDKIHNILLQSGIIKLI